MGSSWLFLSGNQARLRVLLFSCMVVLGQFLRRRVLWMKSRTVEFHLKQGHCFNSMKFSSIIIRLSLTNSRQSSLELVVALAEYSPPVATISMRSLRIVGTTFLICVLVGVKKCAARSALHRRVHTIVELACANVMCFLSSHGDLVSSEPCLFLVFSALMATQYLLVPVGTD